MHSFIPDISIVPRQVHYYSKALPTTALILCWSEHAEALQATTSEGFAQGRYMAARVGFEPATLHTQGTKLTIRGESTSRLSFVSGHAITKLTGSLT